MEAGRRGHAILVLSLGGGRCAATGLCIRCGERQRVECPESGLMDWYFGGLIQEALGGISVDAAEWLVSGLCGRCFDAIWETGGAA